MMAISITKELKLLGMKAVFLLFVILMLSACKKGENDPLISLRTRKARVAGEWKMKEGTLLSEKRDRNYHLYIFRTTYSKNTWERTNDYFFQGTSQGQSKYSGTCKYEMSVKKDGSFKYSQTEDNVLKISYGTWSFSGSVGKHKNKDQLLVTLDSVTNNYAKTIFYKGSDLALTYTIKELRNKKMVLLSEYSFLSSTDREEITKGDYTFEQ
jgi:hypothetical protein